MIPIYVISLKEASERRTRVQEILNNHKLKFEFFDAIDGREFNVLEHKNYNSLKRVLFFGKHLSGGEVGCFLSHKAVYEKLAAEEIPMALIFEDDFILKNDFIECFQELIKYPIPFDMIRFLGSPKLERLKLRPVYRLKTGHLVSRHTGIPGGAHATMVTLKGVKKILPYLNNFYLPIDTLIGRSWQTGLDWYTIRPGLVPHNRDLKSYIGDEIRFSDQTDLTAAQKIIYPFSRAWFKICEASGKKYWYYRQFLKDRKYDNRNI